MLADVCRGIAYVISARPVYADHCVLKFLIVGVADIGIKIDRSRQGTFVCEPRRLRIGAGKQARSLGRELFVGSSHRGMSELVAQLNARAHIPLAECLARL